MAPPLLRSSPQPSNPMGGSTLIKALAAVLMVIDHIGAVFFPQVLLFRYLGRLSFPLFSWFLAQGERRTRNVYRYGQRLLLFGLISQPVYSALFGVVQLNVLFTLLVGLITLRLSRELPEQRYLMMALGLLVAALIPMDGGAYGVAMMLLMAQPMGWRWWGGWLLLHGALVSTGGIQPMQLWAIPAPLVLLLGRSRQRQTAPAPAPAPAPAQSHQPHQPRQNAPTPADNPKGKPAPRSPLRRWFYWFYPAHLLVLWLVRLALT